MISRRQVLLQLAAIPITMSLARRLRADDPVYPKRLVVFMANNGTKRGNFWPAPPVGGGPTYPITSTPILDALFQGNGLQAKTNLLRGLTVTNDVPMNGNEHDISFARMFTGEKLAPTPDGAPWGGGVSVDQILARDWNVRSLTTAVYASEVEDHPKPGFNHRLSFSYLASQTLNLPIIDPVVAYASTFFAGSTSQAYTRLQLRKSVLDSVAGDLTDIQRRLGPDDARKLDFHLTAVRGAETRLTSLIQSQGGCGFAPSSPRDFKSILPGLSAYLSSLETYVPDMLDAMVTLIGAAIKCGVTRVASLQLGYGGGKWKFGWRGIGLDHHGALAHNDHTDDVGTDPLQIAVSAQITIVEQYYASLVRKLAMDLDSVPEGSGTILDNTLVVWAHEFGRGDHQLTDIPIVLVGLVGNGIKQGGLVHDAAAAHGGVQQPFNLVGYHVLNALGHATPGFGDIPDLGANAIDL